MYGRKYNCVETGTFVVTVKDAQGDTGFLATAIMELPDGSGRLCVSVNKDNHSFDIMKNAESFNVCVLDETATDVPFKHFGKLSGRDINKFETCREEMRSKNGVIYLPKFINTVLSVKTEETVDLGDTVLFIGAVTEEISRSDKPSLSHSSFLKNIKNW